MKITRRCALDSARRKTKETQLKTKVDVAIESPNGRLDEDEQRLLAAIVKLPKAEKQVVMLRYFRNNSVNDVAEILGRSTGTVTKQLSRARTHLRKILERSDK